ncbi:ABC transporter ATP-binding protein [Sulfurisphaera ohwakuensis]|uniref:ABC transporter ATP-binding protein n=1 Tax=Sulfurisphaera ohwakuensis TaxID=69656 RepID=UPI0036F2EEB3
MIETKSLKVYYKTPRGVVRAVDNVNISVREKEIVALVGESGSGKTTLGKTILGLIKPTDGKILWNGKEITKLKGKKLKEFRLKNQIIYQDPFDAIDIRLRVYDVVAEGIRLHKLAKSKQEEREMVYNILKSVGLSPPEQFSVAYPTQLSGGQLQRVAIARAIVLNPDFVVADEPVSMLDVSIRADILNIFLNFRENQGTSILMITHDLATAAYVADRIYVMYLGKIVEYGRTDQIVDNPKHPYTQALISSIPIPEPGYVIQAKLSEPDSPVPENGCPLYPRCPFRKEICKKEEPRLKEIEPEHYVACHLY